MTHRSWATSPPTQKGSRYIKGKNEGRITFLLHSTPTPPDRKWKLLEMKERAEDQKSIVILYQEQSLPLPPTGFSKHCEFFSTAFVIKKTLLSGMPGTLMLFSTESSYLMGRYGYGTRGMLAFNDGSWQQVFGPKF